MNTLRGNIEIGVDFVCVIFANNKGNVCNRWQGLRYTNVPGTTEGAGWLHGAVFWCHTAIFSRWVCSLQREEC